MDYDSIMKPYEKALVEKFKSLKEVKLPNGTFKIYLVDSDNLNIEGFNNVSIERMANVDSSSSSFSGVSSNTDIKSVLDAPRENLSDSYNLDNPPGIGGSKLNYYKVVLENFLRNSVCF